jgi:REP element-mobilizing transposase RayT
MQHIAVRSIMAEKFQNKYRVPSARLQHWDYGWDAAYFVTICTKDRECLFGEIVNGTMNLSGIGIIADVMWYEIKNHAKNIELGEFVVMPNHVHGIIILNGNEEKNATGGGGNGNDSDGTHVETTHALSLQSKTMGQQRFQNQGKNTLSSIVGGYKSAVTKHAHRLNFDFAWQSRFHEHIIRDEKSFQTISHYIINNPSNWPTDKFFE